ncbi:MAG: Rho termination factor N-terminal domain-containing protein, partial [Crocinitomicaceae bacterium]
MDKNELESKKIAELREIAKTSGLEGFESMKKAELVSSLTKSTDAPAEDDKPKRKRTRKKVMAETTEEAPTLFEDKKEEKVEAVKSEEKPAKKAPRKKETLQEVAAKKTAPENSKADETSKDSSKKEGSEEQSPKSEGNNQRNDKG